ncbi:TOMM precursor leader peptide-binding protein [Brevibacillus migulae]|uniref:TOMM precursor leader peptide-binding protein n=1 Tax=Brevibacillus migulae TaxID=1644114 RepID=UPI00106E4EA1|nr:TOMM precursor leader peptide-binding protein [Brevibacillus migulae]
MKTEQDRVALQTTPRLREGVKMFSATKEYGYIETQKGLYRIKSALFSAFVEHTVALLDGNHTLLELTKNPPAGMNSSEVENFIETLTTNGFLENGEAPAAPPHCLPGTVVGVGKLAEQFHAHLLRLGMADVDFISLHGQPEEWERYLPTLTGLTVVVTDTSQDPRCVQFNRWAIRHNLSMLFVGLEKNGLAYIGPLWEAHACLPCYECLQLRLNMNDPQGKLRDEFSRHMQDTGQTPVEIVIAPAFREQLFAAAGWHVWQYAQQTGHAHDLKGQVLWLEEDKLAATQDALYPVPRCPSCQERQAKEAAQLPDYPNDLRKAVNSRIGLVNKTFELEFAPTDPKIFSSASVTPELSVINSLLPMLVHSGAGYTPEAALHSAIGETLERYAGSLYDEKTLPLATWKELPHAIHPEEFALFSAEQYAQPGFLYRPFRENTPIRWTKGTDLISGEEVWVPAAMVYIPYRRIREETNITVSLTTGLAAGPTWEHAILTGLYEVIERDALAVSWLCKLPPCEVSPDLIAANPTFASIFPKDTGLTYRFFDLSLDIPVPVTLAMIENVEQGRTMLRMGSAARRNPLAAMDKALLEATQCFPYIRALVKDHPTGAPVADFSTIDTFQKHAVFYTKYPEMRKQVGYIMDPEVDRSLSMRPTPLHSTLDMAASLGEADAKRDLPFLIDSLQKNGYRAIGIDLTTPDLRMLGVRVARAVVPGLVHLTGNHPYRLLGGRRLQELPQKLGYACKPDNPYPHPFA